MKEKKAKEHKIRKPSFFIYTIPAYIVKFIARIYWRMRTDNSEIRGLKGPVLAVSPHASTLDIVPAICTLLPKRYNVVAAKDLFTWKQLAPFMKAFGVIPMNQCAMDLASIKLMKAASDEGRSILLFPEGRTSMDGRQMTYLNPSIGKLAKFLGMNIVLVKSEGVYCTKPRYIKGFRRGRINSKATVLMTAEEVAKAPPKVIFQKIKESLVYNDNVWQQENGVKFKAKELASNLNYVLYKCPRCGAEYRMEAKGDELKCLECGNTVRYTEDGHLVPVGDGISIDRIDLWFDYERESVAEELRAPDFRLEKPVEAYCRDDEKHEYMRVGEGYLYIDKNYIGYIGTKKGAEWRADLPIVAVPTIVTKNAEGIDLIIEGLTYRFMFTEHKYSAKYALIVESLFAERNGLCLTEKK